MLSCCIAAEESEAYGLVQALRVLLSCTGTALCLPPLSALTSLWQQQVLWPGPSCLAAAIVAFLALSPERMGLAYMISQADSLLLACLAQGFVGRLALQLLQAAINLRMRDGQHQPLEAPQPGVDDGFSLATLLGRPVIKGVLVASVLERLLNVPQMAAGTPHVTLQALRELPLLWQLQTLRLPQQEGLGRGSHNEQVNSPTAAGLIPRCCSMLSLSHLISNCMPVTAKVAGTVGAGSLGGACCSLHLMHQPAE